MPIGWGGNDTGSNACNTCGCNDGGSLLCTQMFCGDVKSDLDIDAARPMTCHTYKSGARSAGEPKVLGGGRLVFQSTVSVPDSFPVDTVAVTLNDVALKRCGARVPMCAPLGPGRRARA